MNCKHCNTNMFLYDTCLSDGYRYNTYVCPICLTEEHQETPTRNRFKTKLYFIEAINKKIKSKSGKLYSEFNRGITYGDSIMFKKLKKIFKKFYKVTTACDIMGYNSSNNGLVSFK